VSTRTLIERRKQALGPAYYHFFDEPIHLVKGEGVWMWNSDGRKYLDCYNNVPSVGHCHPRVVDALCKQAGTLNTHTRYLHENVILVAERLAAKLPGRLSVCMLVCTGTEANDLAVQIARRVTGSRGVMVTEASYHGNSDLVGLLSTDGYPASERPDWLAVIEPPNLYRGPYREGEADLGGKYAGLAQEGIEGLQGRGHGLAALMLDPIWDNNGPLVAPPGYVEQLCADTRAAGGLVIADEVQSGYCRTGDHWWGVRHYDVTPDIVTLGKPMGGGHPIGAVVTTPEIAASFAERTSYFNTFGGNPVSAAVALAVMDVIENENLLENATRVGAYLGAGLRDLAGRHETIGCAHGRGLFWGLDLVKDAKSREPLSRAELRHITTLLMQEGILTGTSGRFGNILKIRPPLVFSRENADQALDTLERVFGRL